MSGAARYLECDNTNKSVELSSESIRTKLLQNKSFIDIRDLAYRVSRRVRSGTWVPTWVYDTKKVKVLFSSR